MANIKYNTVQFLKVQSVLRDEAKLGEVSFSEEQMVGMLSVEIRALRQQGKSDIEISALINKVGIAIEADSISKNYEDTTAWESK